MRNLLLLSTLTIAFGLGCGSEKRADNINEPVAGSSGKGGAGGTPQPGTDKGGDGGAGDGGGNGGASGTGTTEGGAAGQGGSEGGASSGGASVGGATAANQVGAPVVTFLKPATVLNPRAKGVIITDSVTVTCKAVAAEQKGSTVDPGSVHITMSQGDEVQNVEPVETAMVNGARESTFTLTSVTSGIVTFSCRANDRSNPVLYGEAPALEVLVDRGPTIEFIEPIASDVVALTNGVDVSFQVTPNPLTASDDRAEATSVDVTIAGQTVTLEESSPGSGQYSGHISLTDPNVFPASEQPNGSTAIQVIAKNERGAITSQTQNFYVDGTAPSITFKSPAPGTIVGANVSLEFTVADDEEGAGVNPESIAVRINSLPTFYYDPVQQARWQNPEHNQYVFTLTEADLSAANAQATIQVTAADRVGNTNSGQSISLYLDFVPPIVHLDPPTVRERYYSTTAKQQVCSNAFDPLGEAANDGQIVGDATYYRALVWDDTNSAGEGLPRYFSGTSQSQVWLYLQDDLSHPLLVDTDGDGFCDDVDPGPDGIRKPPLQLKPVTSAGFAPWVAAEDEALFREGDDTRFGEAPALNAMCSFETWEQTAPRFLCESHSDMVRVIHHSMNASPVEPVIYGNDPSPGTGVECTGRYWEIKPLVSREVRDGWICLAALAYDKVGNRGVSPPLRVCYDDPNTSLVPDCKNSLVEQDKTYHEAWLGWIPFGSLETDAFPDLSAEAPPSCMKACKMREIATPRYIINQTQH